MSKSAISSLRLRKNTVWYFRKFSPTAKIFHQIDLQYNWISEKVLIWQIFRKTSYGKNLQISTLWKREKFIVTFENI